MSRRLPAPGPTRLLIGIVGVLVVLGAFVAQVGSAAAWSASPSGRFVCVVDADAFRIGLDWTVTSWQSEGPAGDNAQIIVTMSRDGEPSETIGNGSFTRDNGHEFSGSVIVPDTTGSIALSAYASSPWGDGTVDDGVTTVELTVPTLTDIGDPRCLVAPEPTPVPTEEPTPLPTPTQAVVPTPTMEPAATPTPQVEAKVEQATPTQVPATPQPTAIVAPEVTPTPEVLGKQLARTGDGTRGLMISGLALVAVGVVSYSASRFAPRRD